MARPEITGKKVTATVDSDDGEPDELVPDPAVAREFNISLMTLLRWSQDRELDFPPKIQIRKRNFRSRRQLTAFKARVLRDAITHRKLARYQSSSEG
jgi:hypothetical protein